MNKTFLKFLAASLLAFSAFGCDTIQKYQSSNANIEDQTRATLGLKKTGIPECDEVVDVLTGKAKGSANAQEESLFERAKTELIKQQIYNYVNDGANKSPQEKAQMAQNCRTALGFLKTDEKK